MHCLWSSIGLLVSAPSLLEFSLCLRSLIGVYPVFDPLLLEAVYSVSGFWVVPHNTLRKQYPHFRSQRPVFGLMYHIQNRQHISRILSELAPHGLIRSLKSVSLIAETELSQYPLSVSSSKTSLTMIPVFSLIPIFELTWFQFEGSNCVVKPILGLTWSRFSGLW